MIENVNYNTKTKQFEIGQNDGDYATKSELKVVGDTIPILQGEIDLLVQADTLMANELTELKSKVSTLEQSNTDILLRLTALENK